jgi:hypothetical protein
MKTLFVLLFLVNVSFAANELKEYDSHGRYVGKAVVVNNKTIKQYDSHGRYTGKQVVQPDNKTVKTYDSHGRLKSTYKVK